MTQTDTPLASRFLQARHYRALGRRGISLVVIHDMEAKETPRTAENVAAWFAGTSAPVASAHYCVDVDSIVQCVRELDIAYAAPGANANGIHIELAGYARNTDADWLADAPMLERAAELVADICKRHDIPVELLDSDDLIAGHSGITTHAAVSMAFHKTTHTDPGPSFPMTHFLALVAAALASHAPISTV